LVCLLIPHRKEILAKMNKCPRCKLPQEGIYKCQYCGYDLIKDKKRHIKKTRKRLKDIIGGLKKGQIVSSNIKSKVRSMNTTDKKLKMADNGGTRSGTDRRKYRYITFYPEKRSGEERRKGYDRRIPIARRRGS
jgi:hypothetical protein